MHYCKTHENSVFSYSTEKRSRNYDELADPTAVINYISFTSILLLTVLYTKGNGMYGLAIIS